MIFKWMWQGVHKPRLKGMRRDHGHTGNRKCSRPNCWVCKSHKWKKDRKNGYDGYRLRLHIDA